jgi:hypothetical protein
MAKCPKCGKKGLFLKLTDRGLCGECTPLLIREEAIAEIEKRAAEAEAAASRADELLAFAKEAARTQAQLELIQQEATLRTQVGELKQRIARYDTEITQRNEQIQSLTKQSDSLEKKAKTAENRITKAQQLYESIRYAVQSFEEAPSVDVLPSDLVFRTDIEEFRPDLKCLSVKSLRALFKKNAKAIEELTASYKSQYTTKANAAIYQLMTMALDAELTNILHDLSFGKLEDGIERVKALTAKYYAIAKDGNQVIAPTLRKFIGQLESFYIEAVKIEYEYYTQQARIKEEQRALREQMRQEAEDRKRLEQQRKQIENEEKKYQQEMARVKAQMEAAALQDEEMSKLRQRLAELESQMANVETKKEDIINLQNGKAGTVYIISNIGSFGEGVYKVGMTRRLEPQERIDELGNASVPFPFDVHCFIFSEDAVALENRLHAELNSRRVNRVNLRKEFFSIGIDELRQMVEHIDPTASFTETALAEQYRQSLSMGDAVASDIPSDTNQEEAE